MAIAKSVTLSEAFANHLFPAGCKCPDDSGSCDWCSVYYGNEDCTTLRQCPHCSEIFDLTDANDDSRWNKRQECCDACALPSRPTEGDLVDAAYEASL